MDWLSIINNAAGELISPTTAAYALAAIGLLYPAWAQRPHACARRTNLCGPSVPRHRLDRRCGPGA